MDSVFSPQFFIMYGLKGCRIFFLWVALYIASRIMQEKYISKVFANQEEPPSLSLFMAFFLGIEFGFMLLFMVILFLAIWVVGNEESPVNSGLFIKLAADYVLTTILIGGIGYCIASVIMKKKYFRYKTDGPRAIRSLEELLLYVGVIIASMPFFLVV